MVPQLFASTETGARRSVLFAITVATGALCLASAASVVVSGTGVLYAALVGALWVGVLVFGGYLQQGYVESLFSDEEFLWQRE
jgi:hypothetical protein